MAVNSVIPELLSPAGGLKKLKYALAYGADAVYAGIPKYSLRTRENDFREASLIEGINYAHAHGKKVYLTLNIYAHNTKIDGFLKTLDKIAEWKPDGLIMADPGMISQTLKRLPDIPVHLSTQANATNWTTIEFWKDLGVQRIILPRELHLKEIQEIKRKVPDVDLESFVHGAICIAYSGRCLISNYMNHRDANQGTCTNSCRWDYKLGEAPKSLLEMESEEIPHAPDTPHGDSGSSYYLEESDRTGVKYPVDEDESGTYMFNAKDLCAVELLEELRDAGIMSVKIEGRTKSEYYAAMSARAYRKALNLLAEGKPFDPSILGDLMALSNREYTTGFYTRNPKEFGQNYHESRSKERIKKPIGMECQWDSENGLLWFDIKNRLKTDTTVTIYTPTKDYQIDVKEVVDKKYKRTDVIHGGAGRGAIPLDHDPGEFAILQRNLYEDEKV